MTSGGVEGDVVVAEDGVAEGRGEGGEDLGAAMDGVAAGDEGEGAVGDEVSGEEDEVGARALTCGRCARGRRARCTRRGGCR